MFKSKRIDIVLILLSIACAILFFRIQLFNLFKKDFNNIGYYYSRQFDNLARWINTENLSEIGAELTEADNGLVYKFPKKINDRVYLKLLLGKPYEQIDGKYKNINALEIEGSTNYKKEFDYSNLHIGENRINITGFLSDSKNFTIRLKKMPINKDKFNGLSVRRIEISVLPESRNFLPNLSLIFTAIMFPFILFCCFNILNLSQVASFILSFISLIFYYILCNSFWEFFNLYHIFIILGVFLLYFYFRQKKGIEDRRLHLFTFFIILTVAINLRWSELERVAFAIPNPDAWHESGLGYRQYADSIKLFTKEGFFAARPGQPHEPFYPLIAKFFLSLFGSSDLHLRFASFFFSILAVWLLYLVAKELFKNEIIALFSAGIVTFNAYLIEQSVLGLRLELEMCFLLVVYYFCFLKRNSFKLITWIILSCGAGGLWLLTKAYNLPIIMFIFGYSILSKDKIMKFKKFIVFLIMAAIAISFLLPYKMNTLRYKKDLFSDTNYYTTDFANREFAGKNGFPKENVSIQEYFFKLHNPFEFVSYHIVGSFSIFYFLSEQIFNIIQEQNHFVKIFLKENFEVFRRYPYLSIKIIIISFITALSILSVLLNKNYRHIVYIIIMGNFANLFVYGASFMHGFVIHELQRTIAQVLPFMAFCVSYGIYRLFNKFLSLRLAKSSIIK